MATANHYRLHKHFIRGRGPMATSKDRLERLRGGREGRRVGGVREMSR